MYLQVTLVKNQVEDSTLTNNLGGFQREKLRNGRFSTY